MELVLAMGGSFYESILENLDGHSDRVHNLSNPLRHLHDGLPIKGSTDEAGLGVAGKRALEKREILIIAEVLFLVGKVLVGPGDLDVVVSKILLDGTEVKFASHCV